MDDMAMFTIRYIYDDKLSTSLGDARAKKWKQMKKRKSTLRLPPDRDSHDLKTTRANYQAYVFMNYDKAEAPPSPLDHGWTLDNGSCIPVRHSRPALPMHLHEAMRRKDITLGSDSGESDSDDDDQGGDSD